MSTRNDEKLKQIINALNTLKYLFDFEKFAQNQFGNIEEMNNFFRVIDDLILDKYKEDYCVQIDAGKKFYRARIIKVEDYKCVNKGIGYKSDRFSGYNWKESKEPPLGNSSKAQRNNRKGETALYLVDDEITACAEVKSKVREYISVAEFELCESINVLDFSKMENFSIPLVQYNNEYNLNIRHLLSTLEYYFSRPAYSDEEYVFSQNIVQHFRDKGINAFKYRSFYSTGKNYTFFDEDIKKFTWNESRVLVNYATANLFISLDKNKTKDLNNIDKIEQGISEDTREKMRKYTQQMWEPL